MRFEEAEWDAQCSYPTLIESERMVLLSIEVRIVTSDEVLKREIVDVGAFGGFTTTLKANFAHLWHPNVHHYHRLL